MAELYRFAAFISYSSKDAAFARRLHRALESYNIPAQLGAFDLVGCGRKNRVFPVFRDREELPSGELGEAIGRALKASNALVIVCSPNAAASPWVNKEIETFLGLGRRERIFAIIAEDAPLVNSSGADATILSFPPAFRGDGLGSGFEPLAADARKGKDGFRRAWLKVVAGVIGVNAGALQDRDRKRRRARRLQVGLGVSALALVAGVAAVWVDTQTWRTRLSTYAESITSQGKPLDAAPFALAGVGEEGALLTARADRADATLGHISATRVESDLGVLVGLNRHDDDQLDGFRLDGKTMLYDIGGAFSKIDLGFLGMSRLYKVTQDGAFVVAQDRDGKGALYSVKDGTKEADLGDFSGFTAGFDLTPDGAFLVANEGDTDGLYAVMNGMTKTELGSIKYRTFSARGAFLFAQDHQQGAALYALNDSARKTDLGILSQWAFSKNRAFLLARSEDGAAALYDLGDDLKKTDLGKLGALSSLTLSDDGAFAIGLGEGGNAILYSIYDGMRQTNLGVAPTHLGMVRPIDEMQNFAFSSDSAFLMARSEGVYTLYALKDGLKATAFDNLGSLRIFVLSGDGSFLIARRTGQFSGTLFALKDAAKQTALANYSLSADGAVLVDANNDGTAALYELNQGGKRRDLGNLGMYQTSMLSRDGRLLAQLSAEDPGTGVVYDLKQPVWSGDRPAGAELSRAVCAANGKTMRPFPYALRRGPSADTKSRPEGDKQIYETLQGRPWNPCDWRGLGAGPEGFAQWLRRLEVTVSGARSRDYKCGEIDAAGHTSAARIESCRLARVPEELIAKPEGS